MRCRPFLSLLWAVTSRYWIHSLFAKTIASIYIESSVSFFLSYFNDLKVSVAETNEKSVSEGVPGNGGHLVEFISFGLLWLFLFKALLSFKFEVSFSNDRGVLSFEVPNLPSNFSTNSNPVASRIKSKTIDWWSSIMAWSWLLNITKVENSNFFVFSSSNDEVSSWRDSDGIDTSVMHSNAIFNVESLVVPDLEVSVPSNRCEVLSSNWSLGWSRDKSDLRDPVAVVVLLDGVFAVTSNVP